jgi:hypothetical protein
LNGKVEEPSCSVEVEAAAKGVHVDARALAPHLSRLGDLLQSLAEDGQLRILALGLVQLDENGPQASSPGVDFKRLFTLRATKEDVRTTNVEERKAAEEWRGGRKKKK